MSKKSELDKEPSEPNSSKKPSVQDRLIPIPHPPDRPLSFYVTPKRIGVKIKTTDSKIQSEEAVIKQCKDYLHKSGWVTKTLYTGGIMTGSGRYATNPAKGIPDTINFHPGTKRLVWIEYKKSHGGVISQEQKEWHNLLTHCGCEVWVVNSLKILKEFLGV